MVSRRLSGRRGLKPISLPLILTPFSRRLSGRRGLKPHHQHAPYQNALSPPIRAAWIETLYFCCKLLSRWSPPIRAAWIETIRSCHNMFTYYRRRLSGRRGLKHPRPGCIRKPACRRLSGRRGLKLFFMRDRLASLSRRLSGRRGLKLSAELAAELAAEVAAYPGGVD